MEIGDALIYNSFIMLIGIIIIYEIKDRNWFKRETWKLKRDTTKQLNNLKIEKVRKELGITKKSSKTTTNTGGLENLISKGISGALSGEEGEGVGGFLGDWLEDHPEVIGAFLKGISEGKGDQLDKGIFET